MYKKTLRAEKAKKESAMRKITAKEFGFSEPQRDFCNPHKKSLHIAKLHRKIATQQEGKEKDCPMIGSLLRGYMLKKNKSKNAALLLCIGV